jgi:hypothetical protein
LGIPTPFTQIIGQWVAPAIILECCSKLIRAAQATGHLSDTPGIPVMEVSSVSNRLDFILFFFYNNPIFAKLVSQQLLRYEVNTAQNQWEQEIKMVVFSLIPNMREVVQWPIRYTYCISK